MNTVQAHFPQITVNKLDMIVQVVRPARRMCPVCHDHVVKNGFYLTNAQGNNQFRCWDHLLGLLFSALVSP